MENPLCGKNKYLVSSENKVYNASEWKCNENLSISRFVGLRYAKVLFLTVYVKYKYQFCQIPAHFEKNDGTPFTSEVVGVDVPVWDEKATEEKGATAE